MIKFGTGGWRAVIGDEFTRENVQLLAAALAYKMKEDGVAGKGFVIGYDRRFLSQEAAGWAAEAFAGRGYTPRSSTATAPPPWSCSPWRARASPYGMAVTASHNPAIYNGIKVFMEGGRDARTRYSPASWRATSAWPKAVNAPSWSCPGGDGPGTGGVHRPHERIHRQYYGSGGHEGHPRGGLHIALDPMYGVSQTALQTILLTARCGWRSFTSGGTRCSEGACPPPAKKTLAGLINFVIEHHCDLGIATDGDADRLGVIDDTGEFYTPTRSWCCCITTC